MLKYRKELFVLGKSALMDKFIYSMFSQKSFNILLNIIPYTEVRVEWVGKKCTLKEAEAGN